MATLGDVENNVYPLTKADLKSSNERNNTDGDIMVRKIESFLDAKKLPKDKKKPDCANFAKHTDYRQH